MTKKNELLNFCNYNLNNNNILQINTLINNEKKCIMAIHVPKERTIEIITNNFDDELLGSMPNDTVIHSIQDWKVVNRE